MPAKDKHHQALKTALSKDGWRITDDPLHIKWGGRDMYVDLGAERLLVAEKNGQKIAVELKSFISGSDLKDTHIAIGQFCVYRSVLIRTEPERILFLALDEETFIDVFDTPLGDVLRQDYALKLVIFDPNQEVILKWIN